jgi:uncharacterized caspase-like protein
LAERDFAVVIGIDNYAPELRQLNGAVNDARAMHEWLLVTAGVPREHAWLVVSGKKPDKPTHERVQQAFLELIARAEESDANRRLYFYFAGHGCSADRDHANLLMANARLRQLGFGIDAREYQKQLLWNAWFPEQLFFYDCCRTHDHAALGASPSFPIDKPQPGSSAVRQLAHYAAKWQQQSVERPTEEELKYRGLFSVALLDGLRGWAARPSLDGDDVVTAASLRSYVQLRMRQLTEGKPIKQEPAILGDPADDLIIARVSQRRTTVRLIAPPAATEITVQEESGTPVGHPTVDGVVTVELAARLHKFAAAGKEKVQAVPTSTEAVEIDLRSGP